eukprot:CAMPEP_0173187328 /NCGR_PEP_ID=MMETSP1141-20130122/10643_1 /TAXON_ID=483371 /ORGANISM="non described non described, Strain CCMP2298" /LENGTH=114 /DNA_ID=CAMNT_0014111143 /DNA_START=267 /DNA_END=608 /DNA_ORIENTATION=+
MMLNWNAIVDRFAQRFDEAFSTSSKKAHFDCIPHEAAVIDGARNKWCPLLLLNAIIGVLDLDSNVGTRRKFNQQKVLFECILEVRSQGSDLLALADASDEDKVPVDVTDVTDVT